MGLDLVDDHSHLVRLLSGFLQVISLAEIDKHALGARRNKGCRSFDEKLVPPGLRAWLVDQLSSAVFEILQDLFHNFIPSLRVTCIYEVAQTTNTVLHNKN